MDTEQYEEAVRDYEKVYQTEKTKGEKWTDTAFSTNMPSSFYFIVSLLTHHFFFSFFCRTQASPEKCPIGVKEKQAERLLQSPRCG